MNVLYLPKSNVSIYQLELRPYIDNYFYDLSLEVYISIKDLRNNGDIHWNSNLETRIHKSEDAIECLHNTIIKNVASIGRNCGHILYIDWHIDEIINMKYGSI